MFDELDGDFHFRVWRMKGSNICTTLSLGVIHFMMKLYVNHTRDIFLVVSAHAVTGGRIFVWFLQYKNYQ